MTVKIVVLKSGEKIIADIKEGYSEDTLVSYFLDNPCIVKNKGTYTIKTDLGEDQKQMSISLHGWPEFSSDKSVAIPPDWLVTVVEPMLGIKKLYEDKFKNDKTSSVDEQSDLGLTD